MPEPARRPKKGTRTRAAWDAYHLRYCGPTFRACGQGPKCEGEPDIEMLRMVIGAVLHYEKQYGGRNA